MASSAQIPSLINEAWFIISYFSVDCDIYFDFLGKNGVLSLAFFTVACKETHHLGILPYKMTIFLEGF